MTAGRTKKLIKQVARAAVKPYDRWISSARRARARLSGEEIYAVLSDSFNELESESLFVHSSLSACGHIEGGASTVIEALAHWADGCRLVMPTHSYCYPDQFGNVEIFDRESTPSKVGAITEAFWRMAGVERSNHPTHSLAAAGPGSHQLCSSHEFCETPCGAGTPYERLILEDSAVLMFGADLNTYTLFHTSEDAAHLPYLYYKDEVELKVREADGSVLELKMRRQNMEIKRRFSELEDWLMDRGLVLRRTLGLGKLLFIPHSSIVHQAVVRGLEDNPTFLMKSAV